MVLQKLLKSCFEQCIFGFKQYIESLNYIVHRIKVGLDELCDPFKRISFIPNGLAKTRSQIVGPGHFLYFREKHFFLKRLIWLRYSF